MGWRMCSISLFLTLAFCYCTSLVDSMSYSHCESYTANNDGDHENNQSSNPLVSAKHPLSSLAPNTFHQICPGRSSSTSLSYPICGDGTTFSFFVTRPPRANLASGHQSKILIEFQGGGACWDADTCEQAKERLTFPSSLSRFSGYSCSETSIGMENQGEYPVNMLCAQSIGDVDLTSYHTIVVPYCTQDVHIGDSYQTYSDNDNNEDGGRRKTQEGNENSSGIYHHGAHNLMSVLRYVYANFKNPSHIFLTGCSAGGTVLPLAYDLLNKHYNHILGKSLLPTVPSVNINVLSDSPVYLTPEYFLSNAFPHWNPETLVKKTHFNYNKWRSDEQYPTKLWDFILRRGPNIDQWGFITHTSDPVSLAYFEAMGGNYFWNDGRRHLNDGNNNNDDDEQIWWSSLSSSLETIKSSHKNVDTFVIDGEGHCSFGLYYALQEDGFENWASGIIKEKKMIGHTSMSVPLFVVSILLGSVLSLCTICSSRQHKISGDLDDSILTEGKKEFAQISQQNKAFFENFQTWPITAGYMLTVTVYFWSMIFTGGFTHPLDNPSLGPSALILSDFGINNPTLIVYHFEIVRLFVSTFLCSGVTTYLIVMNSAYFHARYIEQALKSSKHFGLLCALIILGGNLFYACVTKGASCSSVPLVLGLNAFSIASHQKNSDVDDKVTDQTFFPRPICFTIFFVLFTSLVLPFNSWVMIVIALIFGASSAKFVFSKKTSEDDSTQNNSIDLLSWNRLLPVGVLYVIMFLILMLNRSRNIEIYQYPYLTGCDMIYSDEANQFVEEYFENNGGGDRRALEENDEGLCAQFCVPHLVSIPFSIGANKYFPSSSLNRGLCHRNGFEEHIADTTFTRFTYSLDVSLYTQADQEE